MAQVRLYQQSFNGGEIADSMFSRVTDSKYQSGLAKCRNFMVEPQGPIVSRPGFQRVLEVKDPSKPPRLIPFAFSADQTMVLELGEKYIRFHTQGQTLLDDDGDPYEVETPYLYDDIEGIHYVQSADIVTLVHPSHAPRELRRYGATDWRLSVISFSSELAAPTNVNAVQTINSSVTNKEDYTREYAVTALKADGSQESERSESFSVKCNPYGDGAYNTVTWDPVDGAGLYRIYRNQGGVWAYIGQTEATTIRDENISPDASITPPLYDDPFHMAKGIESVTVTHGGSGYGQVGEIVTVSNTGTLEQRWDTQGSWSSRQVTIPFQTVWRADGTVCRIEAASGSGAVIKSVATPYVSGNYHYELLGFDIESGGSGYPVNGTKVVLENLNPHGVGDRFTVDATILPTRPRAYVTDPTGKGCELTVNINAAGQITDIVVVRPGSGYTNPTVVIESNGGSGATATATVGKTGDYPGAVSYFEGRRWFGGTYNRPNYLWATKSGTESNMGYSLPSQDDDRISASVVARNADRIEHIIPLARMIFLTASAEWLATTKNSDVITQKSLSVNTQSYFGSSPVQPVIVGSTLIYAASRGGHLRECGYSYEAGGYVTADLCLRAPHLFDNLEIKDLSYGKAPYPMVWAVSSDGRLIALTYVPEQQVGAFSTVETSGEFLSCTVVAEGDEDILYAVIRRNINGTDKVFVERMHERQYTKLEDCVYLDCSGTYRGESKTEISGLTWLEGMEVSILADGSVEPSQVVTNGKIVLDEPASVVHVGLPYTCDAQTLPLAMALQDGSFGTSHKKNVISMVFRVVNSSGLKAGPTFDSLTEYPPRGMESAGSPPEPLTTEIEVRVNAKWQATGQCCIRQDNPLPAKIIGMTTKAELV
ncbi:MAG TPA: hypothetical protein H9960_06420 [Candidatus Duodenibacillus intestinigallinarum]|nr:hypothetical protein [Candidatus Duodenibacillus intestinigallinarum]